MMNEMDSTREHGKAKWSLRGEKGGKDETWARRWLKQGRARADAACG